MILKVIITAVSQSGELMQNRFQYQVALFLLIAGFAGHGHAELDLGLCPEVDYALDPNGDGFYLNADTALALTEANSCIANGSDRGYASRAFVYLEMNNIDLAKADVRTALANGEDPYSAHSAQCFTALKENQGDYAKREETTVLCQAMLNADPSKAGGHYARAKLYYSQGQLQPALTSIVNAENLAPSSAPIWMVKMYILFALNRKEEANVAMLKFADLMSSQRTIRAKPKPVIANKAATSSVSNASSSATGKTSTLCPDGHDCTVIN